MSLSSACFFPLPIAGEGWGEGACVQLSSAVVFVAMPEPGWARPLDSAPNMVYIGL